MKIDKLDLLCNKIEDRLVEDFLIINEDAFGGKLPKERIEDDPDEAVRKAQARVAKNKTDAAKEAYERYKMTKYSPSVTSARAEQISKNLHDKAVIDREAAINKKRETNMIKKNRETLKVEDYELDDDAMFVLAEEFENDLNEEIEETNDTTALNAVRSDLQGELTAIKDYDTHADQLEKAGMKDAAEILRDIRDEEKVHVGELQKIMDKYDDEYKKSVDDGKEEAGKELTESTNVYNGKIVPDEEAGTFSFEKLIKIGSLHGNYDTLHVSYDHEACKKLSALYKPKFQDIGGNTIAIGKDGYYYWFDHEEEYGLNDEPHRILPSELEKYGLLKEETLEEQPVYYATKTGKRVGEVLNSKGKSMTKPEYEESKKNGDMVILKDKNGKESLSAFTPESKHGKGVGSAGRIANDKDASQPYNSQYSRYKLKEELNTDLNNENKKTAAELKLEKDTNKLAELKEKQKTEMTNAIRANKEANLNNKTANNEKIDELKNSITSMETKKENEINTLQDKHDMNIDKLTNTIEKDKNVVNYIKDQKSINEGSYINHRDYKTCTKCGANLDFGETCDCEDEKKEIPETKRTIEVKNKDLSKDPKALKEAMQALQERSIEKMQARVDKKMDRAEKTNDKYLDKIRAIESKIQALTHKYPGWKDSDNPAMSRVRAKIQALMSKKNVLAAKKDNSSNKLKELDNDQVNVEWKKKTSDNINEELVLFEEIDTLLNEADLLLNEEIKTYNYPDFATKKYADPILNKIVGQVRSLCEAEVVDEMKIKQLTIKFNQYKK